MLLAVCVLCTSPRAAAQSSPSQAAAPAQEHQHGPAEPASVLFPARESAGTAWQPETSVMYGAHLRRGAWEVMLHGNVFAQVLVEPGERHRTGGDASTQISSVNWGMAMARRPAGAGRVGLRGMISLEPWTVSDCGYLNFLASGEVCEGDTIHDRQHPHDLVMEAAAEYDAPLRGSLRWQVYGGLAGEPALGPGGFPHRLSALPNPVAPVGHHWLDATHITFGVVTAGVYDNRWKAELSLFNGREPDPERNDLDLGPLDSIAGRLSLMPSSRLALQVSAAHLREAEASLGPQPPTDGSRITASATYHRQAGAGGLWATTLAYGVNGERETTTAGEWEGFTHAVLLESAATFGERHTWFGRVEVVQKPAHDLHAHEFGTSVFTVGKLQVGYIRHARPWRGLTAGIGGTAMLSVLPPLLAPRYSGRVAPGFGVFLNIRPSRHVM